MKVGLLAEIVAASDVGLQRSSNEDAFLVLEDRNLCVVADGMGGHLGGEVASHMVTSILSEEFSRNGHVGAETTPAAIGEVLAGCICQANSQIYQRGNSDARLRNMGTTVVATLLHNDHIVFASVGDSRIYRVREGKLTQISEDHSWVGELLKKNLISEEDARHHPLRNIITRALGMEDTVDVDVDVEETCPGDVYLLCTDGLTDLVDDAEILKLVTTHQHDLDLLANALLDAANAQGGADNITVGLCRIWKSDDNAS